MKEKRAKGLHVFNELRGDARATQMEELARGLSAEAVIASLSLDFVFGAIWGRQGLDPKQRSLVTIGVLVALRQTAELENHLRIGLTNGLTLTELQEAIVQTTAYAGFPAAWSAARMLTALAGEGGGDA